MEPDKVDCTLCRHRGLSCTFDSLPPAKKRRRPADSRPSARITRRLPEPQDIGAIPRVDTIYSAQHSPTESSPTSTAPDDANGRRYQSTVVPGRTALWAGSSSDQDVYLLRHLPFDQMNRFGHSNWRVLKVFPGESAPAYFTVRLHDPLVSDMSG